MKVHGDICGRFLRAPDLEVLPLLAAQKCTDAAFCNRLLGSADDGYIIESKSISIAGPTLSARIVNKEKGSKLTLTLTAYDGFVRLVVNEEDPLKKRFEVPGVLMADLDSKLLSWDKAAQDDHGVHLQLGSAVVQLQNSPLQISIIVEGDLVMSFNSRRLFNYEHLRQKQVKYLCSRCSSLRGIGLQEVKSGILCVCGWSGGGS
jgi:alpha 1,3-glucosidase